MSDPSNSPSTRQGDIESMQWNVNNHARSANADKAQMSFMADNIVAWVNANGGEAGINRHWQERGQGDTDQVRVWVRNRSGISYCAPGQRVVMGDEQFHVSEEGVTVCGGCNHLNDDGKHACGCQCWGSDDVLWHTFRCTEDDGYCPGDDQLIREFTVED